jgi:hypothetical protein
MKKLKNNMLELIQSISFFITGLFIYVTPMYWLGINKDYILFTIYFISGTISFLTILFYFINKK